MIRAHVNSSSFRAAGTPRESVRPAGILRESDVLTMNIGQRVTTASWLAQESRREKVADCSRSMAELLEQGGVVVRGQISLTEVGLITGAVRQVPAYRSLSIIPEVAQRDRAELIAPLQTLLERQLAADERIYSLIVTAGPPCTAAELRPVISRLQRRVSRWAPAAKKRFGFEAILRTTEFPITGKSEAGEDLYHVHVHLLVIGPARRPPAGPRSTEALLAWSRRHFGAEVLGPEPVDEEAAAVRYHLKATFSDGRLPETPDEAHRLLKAVHGLKLVQPLQRFAAFQRELRGRGAKIVFCQTPDGLVPIEVEKSRRRRNAGSAVKAAGRLRPNRILATTLPRPVFSRFRHFEKAAAFKRSRGFGRRCRRPRGAHRQLG